MAFKPTAKRHGIDDSGLLYDVIHKLTMITDDELHEAKDESCQHN